MERAREPRPVVRGLRAIPNPISYLDTGDYLALGLCRVCTVVSGLCPVGLSCLRSHRSQPTGTAPSQKRSRGRGSRARGVRSPHSGPAGQRQATGVTASPHCSVLGTLALSAAWPAVLSPLWCVCESDVYRLIAYVSHRSVSSLNCQSRTHSDSVPYIRSQTAVSRSEPLGSVTVSPPLRDSALRTAGSGGLSGLRAGRAVLRHLRSRSLAASRSASGRRARCTMVMDGYATVIGIAYRG